MSFPERMTLQGIVRRQADFSRRAFGPGKRTNGIIAHIQEECEEVVESGHDIRECVDVLILALDLCWRSGANPDDVEKELLAKMEKNEFRSWPPAGSVSQDEKINHNRTERDIL